MNRPAPRILIALLALFVVGAALAAGCASGPAGTTSTATPTTVSTAAGTPADTVTAAGTPGSGLPAVGHARLVPFVPRSAGDWRLDDDPMGMTGTDANGREYSWVTGTYHKTGNDAVQASVQIHDLATAESPLKQQWRSFQNEESAAGSMKSVTVKGQPAWETFDRETNVHGLMAFVGDRYIVYVMVEDGTKADLDTLVNAIDLGGLAGLK